MRAASDLILLRLLSGTTHNGARVMRVSIVNWRTTDHDVDRAIAAIEQILTAVPPRH